MADETGFTIKDHRKVTLEGESAEKHGEERARESSKAFLPPVDFSGFVLGLGQMALIHLGEVPEPQTGEAHPDVEQARHTIDILDMLQEKTRGNLTGDEENLLRHLLSELKLRYVRLVK